jgi:hypothetical protein
VRRRLEDHARRRRGDSKRHEPQSHGRKSTDRTPGPSDSTHG